MGKPELSAAINHAAGEIKGWPEDPESAIDDPGHLRETCRAILSRVGYVLKLLDEYEGLDP